MRTMRTKPPIIDSAKCEELRKKLAGYKKNLDEAHDKALLGNITAEKAKEIIDLYEAGLEEFIIHCTGKKLE
jgi:hypothetical protein